MVTVSGVKFRTGKTLIAPESKVVLAYLKAAKEGKGLAEKALKSFNKSLKK